MKVATVVFSILLIVAALGSIAAVAQNLPHFNHIVLVIQENRTPDNLFGSAPSTAHCGVEYPFETGVDIQDGGPDHYPPFNGSNRCLMGQHLHRCWDINHWHTSWNTQANIDQTANPPSASMDGACGNPVYPETQDCTIPDCPQYSFVEKSDVQQYFDIATNYGFANYMFQTNEGPSFEAHQFLLGGTSAPTYPGDLNNYYQQFVSELGQGSCNFYPDSAKWANAKGDDVDEQAPPYPGWGKSWHDCFDHDTLVDRLIGAGISWRYYSADTNTALWSAVNAIYHLCYSEPNYTVVPPHPCDTNLWSTNMSPETHDNAAPIFTDIANCHLQQVSWVTPDGRWSDHAADDQGLGPSYVANIVDAIGTSQCVDTVGLVNYSYWQDTAIFIVWDDWGGWYDHVAPPPNMLVRKYDGFTNPCSTNPINTWGCGYTYGFRVPLLVVSAYTPAGYVSGSIARGGPGMTTPYIHDFGGILYFIENNFQLPYINIDSNVGYADRNAPDNAPPFLPLADFFTGSYRSFTPVQPAVGLTSDYFINYLQQHPGETAKGPDGDDAD